MVYIKRSTVHTEEQIRETRQVDISDYAYNSYESSRLLFGAIIDISFKLFVRNTSQVYEKLLNSTIHKGNAN